MGSGIPLLEHYPCLRAFALHGGRGARVAFDVYLIYRTWLLNNEVYKLRV